MASEQQPAANEQPMIGGNHYRKVEGEQHWDRAARLGWDPFQYQVTKYVERWKDKNGLADLKKAAHFLQKYIELVESGIYQPTGKKPTGIEVKAAYDPIVLKELFKGETDANQRL